MPSHTTQESDAPHPPVEVPLPFLLALSLPVVAVVMFILLQLGSNAEQRAMNRARLQEDLDATEDKDDDPDVS